MITLKAGELDRLIRIESPVADEAIDGAGSGEWTPVAEVWASVLDMLPSRGERMSDGINASARPARVRMRYRDDVTPNMRLVDGDRVMQIVSGPAVLGRRAGIELVVEDFSPAGNSA